MVYRIDIGWKLNNRQNHLKSWYLHDNIISFIKGQEGWFHIETKQGEIKDDIKKTTELTKKSPSIEDDP